MKIIRQTLILVFTWLPVAVFAQSSGVFQEQDEAESIIIPRWNIKTNLLYDAASTINLGAEFRTGERHSLEIPVNYNAWSFNNDRKWRHVLVQPELRWWRRDRVFDGSFWGVHAHYAYYNVSNLPFSDWMKAHRFQGWLAGIGVGYGHRWNLGGRWALEAELGVGYAWLDFDRFECGDCGERLGSGTKHYFGPTKAALSLVVGIGGTPRRVVAPVPYTPAPEPVALPVIPPAAPVVIAYEPVFAASFITPEVEAVKARSASGRAYLDFVQGRSEILPNFRNNARELSRIHDTLRSVLGSADNTITGITITGHASPEGNANSNQTLSERRAEALRNYLGAIHHLRPDLFMVWGAGEDWDTLDSLVEGSWLPDKYRALEIIRSYESYDIRQNRLMALSGGATYRQMEAQFFPQLRRSDYSIDYIVAPFSVERGKEVLRRNPGSLSLNELFLIANTYESGSPAFNEVFEIAARTFPANDVANINAAATALARRDAAAAARYLDKVRERSGLGYWNNMGMLAWLQGDKARAAEYFSRGGVQGAGNAAELNRHLRSLSGN